MRMGGRRRRRAPSGSVGSSCTVFRVTARLSDGFSVPVTMMKVERSTSSSKTRWPGQEKKEGWAEVSEACGVVEEVISSPNPSQR